MVAYTKYKCPIGLVKIVECGKAANNNLIPFSNLFALYKVVMDPNTNLFAL
jgi:hypothetical protein